MDSRFGWRYSFLFGRRSNFVSWAEHGHRSGRKLVRAFEAAIDESLPAIVISASGGARMQEGILSLMQMAKTSALVQEMKQRGIPYTSF